METAQYYYLLPASSTLHVKGCSMLKGGKNRIFLGSLYWTYQALSVARQHRPDVSFCPYCLGDYV